MALKLFNDSGVAKLQANDGEESITATANGAVKLYYDNAEKLATTSTGVDVTGDLKFNSGYGSAATAYGVRAWVNFNASGTVSVRGSGNVSSVTDNGVGLFTINFATAMPDGNYSVGSWARNDTTTAWNVVVGSLTSLAAPSTTALPIFCRDDGRASVDPTYVTLNIIR